MSFARLTVPCRSRGSPSPCRSRLTVPCRRAAHIAWGRGPQQDGAVDRHPGGRRRHVPTSPRRADRRGADDDPARRHGGVDDDAHAGQRLRAGRRVLLHGRAPRRCGGHRCALLRERIGGGQRFQRRHRRDRGPGPGAGAPPGHDVVELRLVRARRDRRPRRSAGALAADRRDRRRCPGDDRRRRPRRPGPVRVDGRRARGGRLRPRRRGPGDPRGRRSPQRRRQGDRRHAAGAPAPGDGPRAVRQRPGIDRDGAEGVGGRVRIAGGRRARRRRSPSTRRAGPG